MATTINYTAVVVTPQNESFNFDVSARDATDARSQVRLLIERDLPQGGHIDRLLTRTN